MLEPTSVKPNVESVAGIGRAVEVENTTMRIRDLRVDRSGVVAYLRGVAPDKQEIALIHLLEVGVTELLARRRRFEEGHPQRAA